MKKKKTTTTTMSAPQTMHSFLEEQPLERNDYLNDNLCVRFVRKKFKCIIIFFLTICVFSETLLMVNEKVNFNQLLNRFLNNHNSSLF